MERFTPEQRNTRRKKILIRNTLLAFLGYLNTQAATLVAKIIGATSMSYEMLIILFSTTVMVTVIFLVIIKLTRTISIGYANVIFFSQFAIWVVLYGIWVLHLNEVRVIGLFFALTALLFLITNSNLVQSLTIAISASVLHVLASYIGIYRLNQNGSFKNDLLYLGCFLPASLFICYIADRFNSQRNDIKEAKRNAESARDALWGEMELAKKIQTVLLPKKPSIDGYDISAYMAPAAEVGGDYYDIINVDGNDWIVIGDVSGHGVPAGLIMMMVQTSIKIVLSQHPDTDPAKLLEIINEVIADNISKLGENKYMTITVFAVIERGTFYFSGLHQDIMLYRAKTRAVELVETRGIWIGIVDHISGMVMQDSLTLERDDTMLLFTDGITEAVDKDGRMFSADRLERILRENGGKNPDKIKNAIIKELESFTCQDDVTLVILKRIGDN